MHILIVKALIIMSSLFLICSIDKVALYVVKWNDDVMKEILL